MKNRNLTPIQTTLLLTGLNWNVIMMVIRFTFLYGMSQSQCEVWYYQNWEPNFMYQN